MTINTEDYISLTDLGRELGIPLSSVIYYRNNFEQFLPYIGEGKDRRYKRDECVAILMEVRDLMYNQKYKAKQVLEYLSQKYPLIIEYESDSADSGNVPKTGLAKREEELKNFLERIRAEYLELTETVHSLGEKCESLEQQNKQLTENQDKLIKVNQELKAKIAELQQQVEETSDLEDVLTRRMQESEKKIRDFRIKIQEREPKGFIQRLLWVFGKNKNNQDFSETTPATRDTKPDSED